MLKWLVNSGWWLENRHSRESRKPRCCHPGLRAGIGFGCSESLQCLKNFFRVILSCHSRPVILEAKRRGAIISRIAFGGNPYRSSRRLSLVFSLSSLVILTACTDYVSQIEDRYGEWKPNWPAVSGTMTDSRDGQSYKTVTIGTQTWMAENLNYKTTNSFCYEDNASNCTKYGRLYTWDAATTACPSDWHLPTKAEYETLIAAVGGESTAGKMLKATSGWGNSANGVDEYSFSVLPAGYKVNNGGYENEGDFTYFWTSTESNGSKAYVLGLSFSRDAGLIDADKNYGYSVRCVKGEPVEKTSSSNKEKVSSSSKKVESSSSSVVQSVVDPSTVVVGNITDSRDGQSYKTVTIGTQTWMAQNLNYETANSYCYNDSTEYCEKYGRLYTWAAAMDSAGIWSANGKGCGYGKTCSPMYPVRGVCPEGWHLPSQTERDTLFTAVGGSGTAGRMLKSASGWNGIIGNAMEGIGKGSDDYSFSALPAGSRSSIGNYNGEGDSASFWSSTENDSDYVYILYLLRDSGHAPPLDLTLKNSGFSVRCVMD